jgi:hypothetical protein
MASGFLLALSATLLSQPFVEKLTSFEVSAVSFVAPAGWVAQVKEGAARFDTPEGDAFIEIGVAELEPFQSPRECLEEMIQRVELRGWERISIDKHPAARWMGTKPGDKAEIPSAEEAERIALGKTVDTRVTDIVIMGCNGARKWVLRMSAKTRDAAQYGPTFRRVRESFQYRAHANLGARPPPAKR